MTKLKVAILDRIDSHINPGGDTLQIKEITNYLNEQGVEVKVFNDLFPDLKGFDFAFVFNLTRYREALCNAIACIETRVRYILFPIYWDFKQINIPHYNISSLIKKYLVGSKKEIIKTYYDYYLNKVFHEHRSYIQEYKSLFISEKKGIEFIINNSFCLCPNSVAELTHIQENFYLDSNLKYQIIYNGIKKNLYKLAEVDSSKRSGIYCVGGIGPRKNQLYLGKAIKQTNIEVNLIGKANKSDQAYHNKLSSIKNLKMLGWLKNSEINTILSKAHIHIQPSFIETPGLASMEAYALGCKVIVSDVAPVREYFGNEANYIIPHSPISIKEAIEISIRENNEKVNLNNIKNFNERFQWGNVLNPLCNIL